VLDAEPPSDLGGDHDIRVVGEPVCPRDDRDAGRDQSGGDQAAVLAAGQAEFDGPAGAAQRRDRRDERLRDGARPAGKGIAPIVRGSGHRQPGRWLRTRQPQVGEPSP